MKKVILALSGGMDSAVAGYLLKQKGYEVKAVFLRLTDNYPPYPPSAIAQFLGIPYTELDLREDFKKLIIEPFVKFYLCGKTPNPCIWCNQKIKFGILLDKVKKMGADYLATGHYARKIYQKGRYLLLKGIDRKKEQSYFLFYVSQQKLSHILWPLGELSRNKVENIASNIGFYVSKFKESQEICFIPDNNYRLFLENYARDKLDRLKDRGEIVNEQGKILGQHRGFWRYTIGQRHGIGVCSKEPYYVKKIDAEKNLLIVAPRPALFFKEAIVEKPNFFPFDCLKSVLEVSVKIRYRQEETPAIIQPLNKELIRVVFKKPQFAVTPGQAAVFYQGEVCIGGGLIKSAQ